MKLGALIYKFYQKKENRQNVTAFYINYYLSNCIQLQILDIIILEEIICTNIQEDQVNLNIL